MMLRGFESNDAIIATAATPSNGFAVITTNPKMTVVNRHCALCCGPAQMLLEWHKLDISVTAWLCKQCCYATMPGNDDEDSDNG